MSKPTRLRVEKDHLLQMIRAIGQRTAGGGAAPGQSPVLHTGWPQVDGVLTGAGCERGGLHEWFGLAEAWSDDPHAPQGRNRPWVPPLFVLAHLAWQTIRRADSDRGQWVVWIGQRCWPRLGGLIRFDPLPKHATKEPAHGHGGRNRFTPDQLLLERSIFVNPPDTASRLWSADLAMRCTAVTAVVVDGHGFNTAATRRLQLVAQSSAAITLLTRPPHERGECSFATTRWWVCSQPATGPRWGIELLRCRGTTAAASTRQRWVVELDRANSIELVPAKVVDRSDQTAVGQTQGRRTA